MATTTWKQGTITLTNGSATVTGDGTDWDVAELEGGETLAVVTDPPIDFSMTIQAVVGAEEITLTAPWAAATLIDVPYQITRDYTGAPADAPIPQRGDMNPWAIIGEAFRRLNNAIASVTPAWGSITGTLSDQTDLQDALDAKLEAVDWGDIGGTLSNQTDLQGALNDKMNDPDSNGLVHRTGANGASAAVAWDSGGTWTPVLTFATPGDLSVSYASRSGYRMRIGNLVFIEFYIECTPTFSTASGFLYITGMPYSVVTGQFPGMIVNYGGAGFLPPANTSLAVNVLTDGIRLRALAAGVNTTLGASHITSGQQVVIHGAAIYRTS